MLEETANQMILTGLGLIFLVGLLILVLLGIIVYRLRSPSDGVAELKAGWDSLSKSVAKLEKAVEQMTAALAARSCAAHSARMDGQDRIIDGHAQWLQRHDVEIAEMRRQN
jgi:hypothetical protein